MTFFDYRKCELFLTMVCEEYHLSSPTVSEYADDVYRRLTSGGAILLEELTVLQSLRENDQWEYPSLAANRVYKLEKALGRDVTGHAGF